VQAGEPLPTVIIQQKGAKRIPLGALPISMDWPLVLKTHGAAFRGSPVEADATASD